MHLTWFDSNSWLIELDGQTILLDPWLVGSLVFGKANWLFEGKKRCSYALPDRLDAILLSQGLEDHAHPPTLETLDRAIPVIASPHAAKVARALGYDRVTALPHGESTSLGDRVMVQAVPGAPVGPTLVENGYLLRGLHSGVSLYYEPHGYHAPTLDALAPVDVAIVPVLNLKLPLLGAIIKGMTGTLDLAKRLQLQVIVPTADRGNVEYFGLLTSVLRAEGGARDMQALLAASGLSTTVYDPVPGQRFEVVVPSRDRKVAEELPA